MKRSSLWLVVAILTRGMGQTARTRTTYSRPASRARQAAWAICRWVHLIEAGAFKEPVHPGVRTADNDRVNPHLWLHGLIGGLLQRVRARAAA